jgi:hypothetical protein
VRALITWIAAFSDRVPVSKTPPASLPLLEQQVVQLRRQDALETALAILFAIDTRFGRLDTVDLGPMIARDNNDDTALSFCTRFATAFGRLITDPELKISGADFERLFVHHRWLDLIFVSSGFRGTDHLIPLLAKFDERRISFEGNNFVRLLVVRSMNSSIEMNFDEYLRASPASLLAFLFYISSRNFFWPRAFDLRERLLEWLPGRLEQVKLGTASLARIADVYMHCSYAMTQKKHAIKADLMKQMRRACLEAGCEEVSAPLPAPLPPRPTIIVAAENFRSGHSVFRSHSRAIASLRSRFHVVGVLCPDATGISPEEFFDDVIAAPQTDLLAAVRSLSSEIAARRPVLIFYVGVGMTAHMIALASLRLAPIQCVSFGHTATTMSGAMDYFILPEDFAGAPDTFSEKLLTVRKAAMPFAAGARPAIVRQPKNDDTVRIAVSASTMKLNPRLFEALARIEKETKAKTEFQFFPLLASGLCYFELARAVHAWLPDAIVFPELPQEQYAERLAACDLFLCPFPYGNMNSIIDAFLAGLPGVCLDGEQTHAHADTAFSARIGLPQALCRKTVDEYVAAAVRLIDDVAWRSECGDIVARADLDSAFFRGQPQLFCDALAALVWPKGAG